MVTWTSINIIANNRTLKPERDVIKLKKDFFNGFEPMPPIPKRGKNPNSLTYHEKKQRFNDSIWTSQNGQVTHVTKMSVNHLFNTLKMLLNKKINTEIPTRSNLTLLWIDFLKKELEGRNTEEADCALALLLLVT